MRRYEKGKEITKKKKEKHNMQTRKLVGLHELNYY
jgi:hypothetical protein